jgi:hypothetical protein
MAGEAKTTNFMLGTASVLIGPMASVWNLTPTLNAIGLVKNFTMTAEPSYTELRQGVKNTLAHSIMTSNTVKANMEVYEYTGANLSYSLGLDGSGVVAQTVSNNTSALTTTSASTVFTFATAGEANAFNVGDYVIIQNGSDDQAWVRKVSAKSTAGPYTITVSQALPNIAAFPIGTNVRKVSAVDIGSKLEQPFFSAQILGNLADGSEVRLILPKIRITNGFTLGFTTDNYGNLPFEFTVYDLVSSDALYADFAGKQALLLTRN